MNRDRIILVETEFGHYRVAPGNLKRSSGWIELYYPNRKTATGEWQRPKGQISLVIPRERVYMIEEKSVKRA